MGDLQNLSTELRWAGFSKIALIIQEYPTGDLMVGNKENEGRDIFGGIISLILAILLLTEFALWIKVANYKTNKTDEDIITKDCY